MQNALKSIIKKLPVLRELVSQRDKLHAELNRVTHAFTAEKTQLTAELADLQHQVDTEKARREAELTALKSEIDTKSNQLQSAATVLKDATRFVPPGHYYSPIPNLHEIQQDDQKIFGSVPTQIPGVDMREAEQLSLLRDFAELYKDMPFQAQKQDGLRYHFENPSYSYSDAILLHCMIRHVKPKRLIEVGSGYSSCVTLDTNERFFDGAIHTTFIEPYPELFLSLIKDSDKDAVTIIPTRLQDVELPVFDALQANDILFIDSTHVSKINSDVNYIIFEILPRLAPGVVVHFHDIFFPFEYPREWIYEGRAWNEAYQLRAFLQYNSAFSVMLMNTQMEYFHGDFFQQHLPLCLKNWGGSIWIQKHAEPV
ncbi:class I SAM-dependent methyltransferase [Gammaproteobacteria bacterium LSUCC0112]|nr:class I SAM-dependent methyltransferase [Gammaproteobacteria bacterium LSUCC0112]